MRTLGKRRLCVRARLAGWDTADIARWLEVRRHTVQGWLREAGSTVQGRHGRYVFDATRSASLELTFDELITTGAWPDDSGRWYGRTRDDGALPERSWLLPARPPT